MISAQPNNSHALSPLGWKDLSQGTPPSRDPKGRRRRRVLAIASLLLLIMLIFASVRVVTVVGGTNDQLLLQVSNQQQTVIDLRQSQPISPYLFGVNVFPKEGTLSVDSKNNNYTGFMSYGTQIANGLQNAGIKLLRFPGGSWGEDEPNQNHILSYDQLKDFSQLLYSVGADGMVQARISSPIDASGQLQPATLEQRAHLAGQWVDFMSNPNSPVRKQWESQEKLKNVQIHPIKFWSVGNEPDRLINPDTGKPYTVAEYVEAFIRFSTVMHQNNPNIKVFGPEISQFEGVGMGPKDAKGYLWMDDFLKGVGDYERANHVTLLDGVSFHFYPFGAANQAPSPSLLMSSPEEWNYLLPSLRQLIRQDLGRDVPIGVTEINTTSSDGQAPTRGQAALWWADTLGELMNQQVEYSAYFSAEGVEPPYPLFSNVGSNDPAKSYPQTAMFRVMQLFSHLQHNLISLSVQREPISVYATQDDSQSAVSLLFINKSGDNQLAHISPVNTAFGTTSWQSLDISLKGYSMILVTLHHNGGAEAYYFDVPTVNDPAVSPLQQVTCGNKTDALAYNIPC